MKKIIAIALYVIAGLVAAAYAERPHSAPRVVHSVQAVR